MLYSKCVKLIHGLGLQEAANVLGVSITDRTNIKNFNDVKLSALRSNLPLSQGDPGWRQSVVEYQIELLKDLVDTNNRFELFEVYYNHSADLKYAITKTCYDVGISVIRESTDYFDFITCGEATAIEVLALTSEYDFNPDIFNSLLDTVDISGKVANKNY